MDEQGLQQLTANLRTLSTQVVADLVAVQADIDGEDDPAANLLILTTDLTALDVLAQATSTWIVRGNSTR